MSTELATVDANELDIAGPTRLPTAELNLTAIERLIVVGDLAKLSPDERWEYYIGVCRSVGLNPFTQPFLYITLSGKLTLYATKGAAEQLRRLNAVSIGRPDVTLDDGLCMVSVIATDATGRTDAELGIVPIDGLRGEAKANAILKAITKAKRRVTLSMCGLGMLDETEVETIPGAQYVDVGEAHGRHEPSQAEIKRARDAVALTAPPAFFMTDRKASEATYKALRDRAIKAEHPKAQKLKDTLTKSLADDVLVASIKSLEKWLAEKDLAEVKAQLSDALGEAEVDAADHDEGEAESEAAF